MTETGAPRGQVVVKSAAWYTIATFSTKAIAFLTIPLFTRVMTPEDFGQFNVYAAIQTLLLILFGLESHLTLNRARFDYSGRDFMGYQLTLSLSSFLLGMGAGAALLMWPEFFETITGLHARYLHLMILFLMLQPAFRMYLSYQRVLYKYKVSAGLTLSLTGASIVASVVLVLLISDSILGRAIGAYVPYMIAGIVFLAYYWIKGGRLSWRFIKYALPLSVPLIAATLGNEGMLVGSRIVVQQIAGAEDAALVALATSIASIALLLTVSLNNAWAPWLMDKIQDGEETAVTASFRVLSLGVACLSAVVALLGPELVWFMGGRSYESSVWLLPSLMAAVILNLFVAQYILLETYHKKVRLGGFVTLVGAVLNAVGCVVATVVWGYWSVGYVAFASYFALILVHKLIVRRFSASDPFRLQSLVPAGSIAFALIPTCLLLYYFESAFWVRYILAVALMAIFVLTLRRFVTRVRKRIVA